MSEIARDSGEDGVEPIPKVPEEDDLKRLEDEYNLLRARMKNE